MVESGLKDSIHFAVTGKSWAVLRRHFSELIPKVGFGSVLCGMIRLKL